MSLATALVLATVLVQCFQFSSATYYCRPPSSPRYGDFSPRQKSYSVGSSVHFRCNKGFSLVGSQSAVCRFDSHRRRTFWSHPTPICRPAITCPRLSSPLYGSVSTSGNRPGATATYRCNPTFKLVGSSTRRCQRNGKWSGNAPTCMPIVCPRLADPEYGSVKTTGNRPGAKATYQCDSGFELEGASMRRCQSNGEWSGKAPTCDRIVCPNLENPEYGTVSLSGNTPGSKATHRCNFGFKLVGEEVRNCQTNGEWDGEAPTCMRILCPVLENPANGKVLIGTRVPGSTALYTCNSGYKVVGEDTRNCQNNGDWSGQAPICMRINCPDLADPENGSVDTDGTVPGSTATYRCNDNFKLVGRETRVCQSNGQWNEKAPTCMQIVCPDLDDPDNGDVDTDGNTPGSTATYTCNSGFELMGKGTRSCQSSGEWDGVPPVCMKITCPDLADPDDGSVKIDREENTPGSMATYSCDSGFKVVGATKRTCETNGEWSGEAPTCMLITCPDLEDPEGGSVSVDGNTPGSTATYSCNFPSKVVGERTRTCQDNGEWSGQAPTCMAVTCPPLENPENGQVFVSSQVPGSVALYSCNRYFKRVGEESRECQENGEWTGDAPTCMGITCPELEDPDDGSVNTTGNSPGSEAMYRCNQNFELAGQDMRKCQGNGEWSGEAPTCEEITCPDLSNPKYGSVSTTGKNPGDTATYRCNSGFKLVGKSMRGCQGSGKWDGEAPICMPVFCPKLSDPEYGSVTVTTRRPGTLAVYQCNKGFQLVGRSTRRCLSNGQWSGKAPTCRVSLCPRLNAPRYGSVHISSLRPGGSARYSCDFGFVLSGSSRRSCQSNGQWSGKAPSCIRIGCPRLRSPAYGSVHVSGTSLGSRAFYSCNPGFGLYGSSVRRCLSNRKWSGSAPTCRRLTSCGKPPAMKYGHVQYSGTGPGARAFHSCRSGYVLRGTFVRRCLSTGHWSHSTPYCVRSHY